MTNSFKNKGATLIELIILISVLAIIGSVVAGLIIFFAQLFIYSPRQLTAQKIAQELSSAMLEGNQDIRGARYSRVILDANSTQLSYTYGYPTQTEQLSARFRWNATDSHIYCSTSADGGASWSAETIIPYYLNDNSNISIDGKDTSGIIFTYKKAGDIDWVSGADDLSTIRRVIISINVRTGAGNFASFQGSSNSTFSCEIKGFQ